VGTRRVAANAVGAMPGRTNATTDAEAVLLRSIVARLASRLLRNTDAARGTICAGRACVVAGAHCRALCRHAVAEIRGLAGDGLWRLKHGACAVLHGTETRRADVALAAARA